MKLIGKRLLYWVADLFQDCVLGQVSSGWSLGSGWSFGVNDFLFLFNNLILVVGLPIAVISLCIGGYWQEVIVGLTMFIIGDYVVNHVILGIPNKKIMHSLYMPMSHRAKTVLFMTWFSILAMSFCVRSWLAIGIYFFFYTPPGEGFYRLVFLIVVVSLPGMAIRKNIIVLLNMDRNSNLTKLAEGSLLLHKLGIVGCTYAGYVAYIGEKKWLAYVVPHLLEIIGLLWILPSCKKIAFAFSTFAQHNKITTGSDQMNIINDWHN